MKNKVEDVSLFITEYIRGQTLVQNYAYQVYIRRRIGGSKLYFGSKNVNRIMKILGHPQTITSSIGWSFP